MSSKKKRGGASEGGGEDPPSRSAGRGRGKVKGTLKERRVRSRNIYWDGGRGAPAIIVGRGWAGVDIGNEEGGGGSQVVRWV